MRKRWMGTVGLVLAAVLCFGGCKGSEDAAEAPPAPVRVEVTNQDWDDIAVYAVYRSQRLRLGRITTGRTEVFTLPPHLVDGAATLQFLAVATINHDERLTQPLTVYPGQTVFLVNGPDRWTHVRVGT